MDINKIFKGATALTCGFLVTGCIEPLNHLRMAVNESYENLRQDEVKKEDFREDLEQETRDAAQAISYAGYQCGAALRVIIDGDSYQAARDYLDGARDYTVSVQAISALRFYYNDEMGLRQFIDLEAGETRFLTTDVFEPAVDRDAAFCLAVS